MWFLIDFTQLCFPLLNTIRDKYFRRISVFCRIFGALWVGIRYLISAAKLFDSWLAESHKNGSAQEFTTRKVILLQIQGHWPQKWEHSRNHFQKGYFAENFRTLTTKQEGSRIHFQRCYIAENVYFRKLRNFCN